MEMVDAAGRIVHCVHYSFAYVHGICAGGNSESEVKEVGDRMILFPLMMRKKTSIYNIIGYGATKMV